ncbi:MAG TPA: hypothetical protein VEW48_23705 [Thermoanaerobaculia bacterium]|nr:hypothetical protein [Thermoanaerobaculia bacterium]
MEYNETQKDYKFKAELRWADGNRLEVPCKLFLPVRLRDDLRLVLLLTNDSSWNALWEEGRGAFELSGDVGEPGSVRIVANEVQIRSGMWRRHWNSELAEGHLLCYPRSLRIIRKSHKWDRLQGTFRLTRSELIAPHVHPTCINKDGTIEWHRGKRFTFQLCREVMLTFDHEYRHTRKEGEILMWPELVAKVDIDSPPASKSLEEDYIPLVDDLLLLVSLAEGRRCFCLQVEWTSNEESVHLFRLDRHAPLDKPVPPPDALPISPEDFPSFLEIAFKTLCSSSQRGLIWNALANVTFEGKQTIGTNFARLFAALETLVLAFRKEHDLECVLEDATQRKEFKEYLKEKISEYEPLKGEKHKDKRAMIYENLESLGRVSLKRAIEKFVEEFHVDLDDVWPIFDKKGRKSLYELRNMLVHGDDLSALEEECISEACISLRETTERFLLTMLGWNYNRRLRAQRFLSRWGDWQRARDALLASRASRAAGESAE